jgi:hypothetical protein
MNLPAPHQIQNLGKTEEVEYNEKNSDVEVTF